MKSSNKNNTIDAIHNSITTNLKNENNNKYVLLKELNDEKKRFLKLKTRRKKNLSIDELDEYLNLKDNIKLKTEKLSNINNQKDLINYLKELMTNLKTTKDDIIVYHKYFLFTLGGSPTEIFKYSQIIWDIYTKVGSIEVPYILDGMMYGCMWMCVRERERERDLYYRWYDGCMHMDERERERERE